MKKMVTKPKTFTSVVLFLFVWVRGTLKNECYQIGLHLYSFKKTQHWRQMLGVYHYIKHYIVAEMFSGTNAERLTFHMCDLIRIRATPFTHQITFTSFKIKDEDIRLKSEDDDCISSNRRRWTIEKQHISFDLRACHSRSHSHPHLHMAAWLVKWYFASY